MEIKKLITKGIDTILIESDLEKELKSGKKLRVKLGIDPTSPELHLGHVAVLLKMKEFQEHGHTIIFLIGDFTAKIGDPSGNTKERPLLSNEEIRKNMTYYTEQAAKIVDIKKTEVRYNSEWFKNMKAEEFYKLSLFTTIDQILQRDLYKEREKAKKPLRLYEVYYPLLQGYDSVMLKADVELGGSDQLFNLKYGRELQRQFNQKPQNIMTIKLLIGLDGKRKMSKSLGNYISINDDPSDMYGKIMSVPDDLIFDYFELATELDPLEISDIKTNINNNTLSSKEAKEQLAYAIVKLLHSEERSKEAQEEFQKVFREHKIPAHIPEYKISEKSMAIPELMVKLGLTESKSEAKKLIEEGAVEIMNEKIENWEKIIELKNGSIVKVGKRKFARVKL